MPITNRRVRKPSAALMAVQTAKGSAVTDFTLGADSIRLWTSRALVPAANDKSADDYWMTGGNKGPATAARYSVLERAEGALRCLSTPQNLKMLLRSNWGTVAAGVFTLKLQPAAWMTLAWVEDTAAGSTQKLVRIVDTFVHRLVLAARHADGRLVLEGEYVGRQNPNTDLDALGGIVIPAAPIAPTDRRVYNLKGLTWRRDPTGADVSLPFINLEIGLIQNAVAEWTKTDDWQVYKGGPAHAEIRFVTVISDETWKLIEDNRARVKQRFRIVATAPADSETVAAISTLTIDLYDVDFEFEELGHDERGWRVISVTGSAHDTGTTFVGISIT